MGTTTIEIATAFGLSEQDLFQQALISFLYEKKRQILQSQLEILQRYNVSSFTELEAKITNSEVPEHPAWEDCIVAENLTTRLEGLNAYLEDLQHTTNNCAE